MKTSENQTFSDVFREYRKRPMDEMRSEGFTSRNSPKTSRCQMTTHKSKCFAVNFVKLLRTPFLQNTSRRVVTLFF